MMNRIDSLVAAGKAYPFFVSLHEGISLPASPFTQIGQIPAANELTAAITATAGTFASGFMVTHITVRASGAFGLNFQPSPVIRLGSLTDYNYRGVRTANVAGTRPTVGMEILPNAGDKSSRDILSHNNEVVIDLAGTHAAFLIQSNDADAKDSLVMGLLNMSGAPIDFSIVVHGVLFDRVA